MHHTKVLVDNPKYKTIYDRYQKLIPAYEVHIFIPIHTPIILWCTAGQAITYLHSLVEGPSLKIPNYVNLRDMEYSLKDTKVPLVKFTDTTSRIIADLSNTPIPYQTEIEKSHNNTLWVKLYEELIYIPTLNTTIIGYGVWELSLPITKEDCKTYHPTYCHSLRNPIPSPNWGNWGIV